jgi:hypothetical protein
LTQQRTDSGLVMQSMAARIEPLVASRMVSPQVKDKYETIATAPPFFTSADHVGEHVAMGS